MNSESEKFQWAFFGSSEFSVDVLNELERLDFLPSLIITTPEKPRGRGLNFAPSLVKTWAESRKIKAFTPDKLKSDDFIEELRSLGPWDFFLVASYGKIIPAEIFDLPKNKTLNIHPSLLPEFRGPTPIESAILIADKTGVSLMLIDDQVDHGAIISQKPVEISDWPPYCSGLSRLLAEEGARLFFETVPDWLAGKIVAQEQDHDKASFTKKFSVEDRLIDLDDDAEKNLRKIRAFANNRNAYFLAKTSKKEIRVAVTMARIENDKLIIEKVKPENKNEMSYEDFRRGLRL